MWIIRFQHITPAQYNLVSRYCKKQGFFPRQTPPIVFVKSFILHLLQKKSWRNISIQFGVSHIQLHSFYSKHKHNSDFVKILHAFAKARIIVFTGNTRHFDSHQLDNSSEFLKLTLTQLDTIFEDINS
ncbi:hypothetical protein OAN96_01460 [Candidatus Gracilibacteria bacterium]|nr:hypothetical protein [Candidatus Gracilibacteria bacterium]